MARPVSVERPWGQPLTWREVVQHAPAFRMVAGPAVRSELAGRLELEGLDALVAELAARPWLDGVEVSGRVSARAQRICGVSLEPFEEVVDEPFLLRAVPAGSPNAAPSGEEIVIDLDAEDPPEEIAGDSIDLASFVVEALALGLSPFPRRPDAVFEPPEETTSLSPFAGLAARLKDPDKA